jgi:hypothetical protein
MYYYTICFASADLSHNIAAVPSDESIITSSFNLLHITSQLSQPDLTIIIFWEMIIIIVTAVETSNLTQPDLLASKLPNRREQLDASLSTAFLSIDGIKHNTWVFRGKNRFSHFSHLWLFEGNLRKYFCMCNHIYSQAALAFLAHSSMVGLSTAIKI